jgi:hypothetical protein
MDAERECHLLFVPVHQSWFGNAGPVHGRHAVGTTGRAGFLLRGVTVVLQGSGQQWIRLHGQAIRDMLQPIGADHNGPALLAGPIRAIC